MAASVDAQSPDQFRKESTSLMGSSPLFSPSSDKRFWSNLRNRIDSILEERNARISNSEYPKSKGESVKRLKEDSLLLLRGFDSVAHTLSQLSNNLDNALQGTRDLAKPPTWTEIFNSNLKNSENKEKEPVKQQNQEEDTRKGLKRKFDNSESSDGQGDDDPQKESKPSPKQKKMNKAKNLAISMATKAASLAMELKLIKSDLCFVQERCGLLEEENMRLRDGFDKGIRPEEDDLVRLQLEALLAEKSRLASENSNLIRENQCLHQLVEYHQLTSHDLSASYDQIIQGMCLDFSSPSSADNLNQDNADDYDVEKTWQTNITGLSTSLGESFQDELKQYN